MLLVSICTRGFGQFLEVPSLWVGRGWNLPCSQLAVVSSETFHCTLQNSNLQIEGRLEGKLEGSWNQSIRRNFSFELPSASPFQRLLEGKNPSIRRVPQTFEHSKNFSFDSTVRVLQCKYGRAKSCTKCICIFYRFRSN